MNQVNQHAKCLYISQRSFSSKNCCLFTQTHTHTHTPTDCSTWTYFYFLSTKAHVHATTTSVSCQGAVIQTSRNLTRCLICCHLRLSCAFFEYNAVCWNKKTLRHGAPWCSWLVTWPNRQNCLRRVTQLGHAAVNVRGFATATWALRRSQMSLIQLTDQSGTSFVVNIALLLELGFVPADCG